jgi:hypothetical protein
MPPLPHGIPDFRTRFQHDRPEAALEQMGGGRETDRTCSYDRNGFAHSYAPSGKTEIEFKISSDFGRLRLFGADSVGAALINQKTDKAVHDLIVGAADQGGGLPFLNDEADRKQSLEMIGQSRTCQVEFGLQLADAQATLPRAHKRTVNAQTGRVSEGFQAAGGVINLHKIEDIMALQRVNCISGILEV